jgi:hypothetical protein
MAALGHPNGNIFMSLLLPLALAATRKFARLIGEVMRFVGHDGITWGSDYAGFSAQILGAVKSLVEFHIPEDMQMDYGYQPITDEDRAKMFGGNLSRLMGIDTTKR